MHNDYADIRELVNREPDWWDENGVPRWGEHHPSKSPDIYAGEVALILIACQACGRKFKVQATGNVYSSYMRRLDVWYMLKAQGEGDKEQPPMDKTPLASSIKSRGYHYGDPPNMNCCPGGPTMNCDDLRVIEYWRKDDFVWVRDPALEVSLEDET